MAINTLQCEYGSLLANHLRCPNRAGYMSKSGNIFLCANHILSNSSMYIPLGVTGQKQISRAVNPVKPLVLSKNRMLVAKG